MKIVSFVRRLYTAHPKLFAWAAYTISLAALCVILQFFHKPVLRSALAWPFSFHFQFLVNLAILSLFFAFLYALFNSAFYAMVTTSILIVITGYANHTKIGNLNEPLLPSDFLFLKELAALEGYYIRFAIITAVAVAAIIIALWLLRKRVPHLRANRIARAGVMTCVVLIAVFSARNYHRIISVINGTIPTHNINWNQLENYRQNGVIYGFIMNIDCMLIEKPGGYSRAKIVRILGNFRGIQAKGSGRRPNVIVCMSESFWDIRRIHNLDIGFDPVPYYRSLTARGYGINIVTSTFGGGTCDPEFEIITGLPVKYFPWGSKAFQQYVMRRIPSIARVFGENGYHTAGVHTHFRWYWNRDDVYRFAGFNAFRGIEDMNNPEMKGLYASDHQLVKAVIEETRMTDKPYFIFAITMQNHGPFHSDRYTSFDHQVPDGILSSDTTMKLNNYVQGLADADRSLRELTAFVDAQKEPTILVFFGDHLPGIDTLFTETGYFSDSRSLAENDIRRYTECGVVYANFPVEKPNGKMFSTEFLPLYIAELAGIGMPPFYGFLDDIRARYPVLSRNLTIDARGNTVAEADSGIRAVDDRYWTVIYDILFGENYSDAYFSGVDSVARTAETHDPSSKTE